MAVEHGDRCRSAEARDKPAKLRKQDLLDMRGAKIGGAEHEHARAQQKPLVDVADVAELGQRMQAAPGGGRRDRGAPRHLGERHLRMGGVESLDDGEPLGQPADIFRLALLPLRHA